MTAALAFALQPSAPARLLSRLVNWAPFAAAPRGIRRIFSEKLGAFFYAPRGLAKARRLQFRQGPTEGRREAYAKTPAIIEVQRSPARGRGKLCRAPFAAAAIVAALGAAIMSLTVALNTAVSGLFANQTAIAATSENIANVNTPNFSRREARFQTDAIPNQFAGVDVEIVRAAADRFLQNASFGATADAAASDAIARALSAIEASLGAPGDNISFANRLEEAFAALTSLGANPSSTVAKTDALAALQEAFDAFARTSGAIAEEGDATLGRLNQDVARANALLDEIFRLNQTVSQSPGAADLIDQRLTELSALVSIDVERGPDGRVSVSLPNGALLVNSAGANTLGVTAGPPAAITLGGSNVTAGAVSGSIAGHVALLNVELPRLGALVETTARGVADRFNAVYAGNVASGATAPSGVPLIVETAGVFSVSSALLADPASFAIARPAGGAPGGANDGAGAILLSDVAATTEARAAANAVAAIGASAEGAKRAAETDGLISAELSSRAAASAGVNLDEELSNLILYQRAYSANARVIAAVDELWRSLLQIV
jgi:flagellar hook-associated protein 1 FlgK